MSGPEFSFVLEQIQPDSGITMCAMGLEYRYGMGILSFDTQKSAALASLLTGALQRLLLSIRPLHS